MDEPGTHTRGRATIEDVAAAAAVSVATVSRALRGLPNVAASTRQRVEQAAAQLNYRADPAASRLATGRSRALAAVVPFINNWYFSEVMAGVEAVAGEAGYDTVIVSLGNEIGRRRTIDDTGALHRRVDGLILVDMAVSDEEVAAIDRHGLVLISIGPELRDTPSTGIDDIEVGRLATQHLIDLGHRRIGIIGDRTDSVFWFVVPRLRHEGYVQACESAGIPIDPRLFVEGSFTVHGGADAFGELMALDDPPTAVFAIGDIMAFGALQRAHELGLDVPGDVSIIGVDDQPVAEVLGLTTVHQDVAEHGARAARWLVERLAGLEAPTERVNGPIELVARRTTAAPVTAAAR